MTTKKALLIKKCGSPKRRKRGNRTIITAKMRQTTTENMTINQALRRFNDRILRGIILGRSYEEKCFMTKLESLSRSLSNLVR